MDLIFPYKIGDLAESRSFAEGFRGAWFRCKIHDMRVAESGHLEYYLEYIDYPGENKEWITLFQKNPAFSNQHFIDQIMIRPSFPQWHWEDQAPEQIPDNVVVAIVHESWEVGDLVDWFNEGCYWSGKITKLLNKDTLQVQLHKPPTGEGQRYDANRNDIRPTLEWSLLTGWTVPESQAKGKYWRVAELIHPKSTESESSDSEEEVETSAGDGEKAENGGHGGGDSQDVQPRSSLSPCESEMSGSEEEISPIDGDKAETGVDGGDIQDVQPQDGGDKYTSGGDGDVLQDVQLPSDTSQKAPGSPILEPSSAPKSMSRLDARDDATLLMPMTDMEPSSPSTSGAPSDSVQPAAVTSSQPDTEMFEQGGMESSNKYKQTAGILRQCEQRLGEVDDRLKVVKDLMERMRSMDHRPARIGSFRVYLG